MGIFSTRVEKSELSPGDHIYSWRMFFTYAHHGIYIGENKVVHFTQINSSGPFKMWCACSVVIGGCTCSVASAPPPPPGCPACEKMRMGSRRSCGSCSSSGVVMVSCLDCFLAGGPLHRYEYGVSLLTFWTKIRRRTCSIYHSSPACVVIERALYMVDKGFGRYHLFDNNCLHFCTYCKTGHWARKEE